MTYEDKIAAGHGVRQAGTLMVFILIVGAVVALGAMVTQPALPVWYFGLVKPAMAPEDWVFGPVRTLFYLMMATAGWLLWRNRENDRQSAGRGLTLYGVQLGLNLLWSILFFSFHLIALAAVESVLLFATIAAAVRVFRRVTQVGAYLLLPSLVWVGYATVITFQFWSLN